MMFAVLVGGCGLLPLPMQDADRLLRGMRPVPIESPVAAVPPTGHPTPAPKVTGIASWYRYVPGGAAAGPALRRFLGPDWRGQVVTVCATRCIRVTLSDFCRCDTAGEKLIDLDSDAYAMLAPLRTGIVRVTVTYERKP